MLTAPQLQKLLPRLTLLLFCGATAAAGVKCGFGGAPMTPSGQGGTTGTGGSSASGSGGAGGSGNPTGTGGTIIDPGSGGAGGGAPTGTGGSAMGSGGTAGSPGTGGMGGAAGAPASNGIFQYFGHTPNLRPGIATKPGTLQYTKVVAHDRFLAESCSIADYNKDGMPDVSSGRRWFEGPAFTTAHIFRGGHDDLPRNGDAAEITEGVSDDWSDFPFDVDGDGWTDIINIASSDANTSQSPAPMPQLNATAYWYKNPGATAATAMWAPNLIHTDVRHEQHGFVDVDGDGKPEIFGACKGCSPPQTKGYYKMPARTPPPRGRMSR